MRTPPHSWTTLLTRLGFCSKKRRARSNTKDFRKLRFEQCEDRRMLAIMVDVFHDNSDPNDNKTTLREAIEEANFDIDHDEIFFDPAVFSTPQTILLTQGELSVTNSVTIDTKGKNITIDASGNSNIFTMFFTVLVDFDDIYVFRGLNLTGGNTEVRGGAIRFDASGITDKIVSLTIEDCYIYNNHASGHGGGVYAENGDITIRNTLFENNTTGPNGFGGGAQIGSPGGSAGATNTVLIQNSLIAGNKTTPVQQPSAFALSA